MRFSIRIYEIKGRGDYEITRYSPIFPNYWEMMAVCDAAGMEDIVDFENEKGGNVRAKVVKGRVLKNRFNGMTPVARFEIAKLTDDETEIRELTR